MKHRFTTCIAGLALLFMAFPVGAQNAPPRSNAPAAKSTAKPWAVPKTPWGDPDIQGTWTSDDCIGTPINRPANLGDKAFYTEQELAQREGQLARRAEADSQEFAPSDARVGTGPPSHWAERARRP